MMWLGLSSSWDEIRSRYTSTRCIMYQINTNHTRQHNGGSSLVISCCVLMDGVKCTNARMRVDRVGDGWKPVICQSTYCGYSRTQRLAPLPLEFAPAWPRFCCGSRVIDDPLLTRCGARACTSLRRCCCRSEEEVRRQGSQEFVIVIDAGTTAVCSTAPRSVISYRAHSTNLTAYQRLITRFTCRVRIQHVGSFYVMIVMRRVKIPPDLAVFSARSLQHAQNTPKSFQSSLIRPHAVSVSPAPSIASLTSRRTASTFPAKAIAPTSRQWSTVGLGLAHTERALPPSWTLQQFLRMKTHQRRLFSNTSSIRYASERKDQHRAAEKSKEAQHATSQKSPPESETHHHNLLDRLPHLHRPTKEELLAAATGFWQRLGVRFKWFSIRSARPFNTDDIGAFISWVFLGHIIWIIVGTTTFFSLAIFAVNTVFAQETLARWVGNYLTKSSGVKVVFESAIVPKWGDGVITFRNVFVSRRPGQGKANVSKGSPVNAAAEAAAKRMKESGEQEEKEDTNYTQYDIAIDTVNVTLSFTKWFNGKGPLRDVEMKGIRGVVDRTSVEATDPNVDPKSYRHEHSTGDFEIDTFKLEDLLVTVYQPNDFRPFSVSIFSCELPRLRKQWLFYDLMSANMISGSFDDSLFTIHPRQAHNHTGSRFDDADGGDASMWKKHSRIRVDGLNIDHLNRGVEGPFSWIREGNVDIVADIMFPVDDDGSIAKVMSDFYDRMEATVTKHGYLHTTHQHDTNDHHDARPEGKSDSIESDRFIVMDLRVHMNDVRAAVPIFTRDLSYVNNALVRPIVAYINSKRTFIPVNCRVVKRTSEFDGSWTIFDSGLLDDLSREVSFSIPARDSQDTDVNLCRHTTPLPETWWTAKPGLAV